MSESFKLSTVTEKLEHVFERYATKKKYAHDDVPVDVLEEVGHLSFWKDLGVLIGNDESQEVYNLVATADEDVEDKDKKVTLQTICSYLVSTVLKREIGNQTPGKILHRLLMAETKENCIIQVKLMVEHLWQMQSHAIRCKVKQQIKEEGENGPKELLVYSELAQIKDDDDGLCTAAVGSLSRTCSLDGAAERMTEEHSTENAKKLMKLFTTLYKNGKTGLEKIHSSKFSKLERRGDDGRVAMKEEGQPASPINVGLHNLTELFDHMAEQVSSVIPEYASVKAQWNTDKKTLIFPDGFSKNKIPTEIATEKSLKYYNCTMANYDNANVALMYAGHIHKFTYSKDYHDAYVTADCGDKGASLERHAFPHLDCPMDKKSGVLVIGKYVDEENEEELHLTGFVVPAGNMVYIPGNVIHTNNYLRDTWITMLSEPDKEFDQVKMVEGDKEKPFSFCFSQLQY